MYKPNTVRMQIFYQLHHKLTGKKTSILQKSMEKVHHMFLSVQLILSKYMYFLAKTAWHFQVIQTVNILSQF